MPEILVVVLVLIQQYQTVKYFHLNLESLYVSIIQLYIHSNYFIETEKSFGLLSVIHLGISFSKFSFSKTIQASLYFCKNEVVNHEL
jgi:hypothetical protein